MNPNGDLKSNPSLLKMPLDSTALDESKENDVPQQVVEQVEEEYVPEELDLDDTMGQKFRKIFGKFLVTEIFSAEEMDKKIEATSNAASRKDDSDSNKDEQVNQPKEKGTSVGDATSSDPKLIVLPKSYQNSVPVPRHWCKKRKFLQGHGGIEKQPFQLPDFISATRIEKIRQGYIEKEDSKKLKHKQRECMQPNLGKMDIDYQTKPKLSSHGELYHEGKESEELKEALGMPEGAPPPWLINMQRYGPRPSYPHLKIPGLNAPIPPGASFGYHPGGWGKPPVDECGRPLHGDGFGVHQQEQPNYEEEPIDKTKHWGDLEEEEEEEEEEQMEAEELPDDIESVEALLSLPTRVQEREEEPAYFQVIKMKKTLHWTPYPEQHIRVCSAREGRLVLKG